MISDQIIKRMQDAGLQCRLVSVSALSEARELYARLDHSSLVWKEYLSRLKLDIPEGREAARSILIAAAPSSAVRVTFRDEGGEKSLLIPPTYLYASQKKSMDKLVEDIFSEAGHSTWPAHLPEKILSAMSGLSRYGRNNIAYVEGLGSYAMLRTYFTTAAPVDELYEMVFAQRCESCSACISACPTGAITKENSAVNAQRCITLHTEREAPFPEWIPKNAYRCIVGCMRCQECCPMNAGKLRVEDGPSFDDGETRTILSAVDFAQLTEETQSKIARIEYDTDYGNFIRNVGACLRKMAQ